MSKKFILLDTFLEDGFYVTQNYFNNPGYYKKFNLLGHEGVDFGNKNKKVMVRSPLIGTAFVGQDKNYGWFTVIEDYVQGCAIYLCHTLKPVVVSGQEIIAGDDIAEMDDTGNSIGEHCHLNFLILNESGSNKYRIKSANWGFLDPFYPRDTGKPKRFAGVEDYDVEWVDQLEKETMTPLLSYLGANNDAEAKIKLKVHLGEDGWGVAWGNADNDSGGFLGSARREIKKLRKEIIKDLKVHQKEMLEAKKKNLDQIRKSLVTQLNLPEDTSYQDLFKHLEGLKDQPKQPEKEGEWTKTKKIITTTSKDGVTTSIEYVI